MNRYPNKTIQPIKYSGEILLRRAPLIIGARVPKGNRPDTYQVTRIEPNGFCFGVHVDFLERFRIQPK
ncbi:MAG: hypothetical protein V7638_3455 [Acidobacteriota bacterium]